MKIKISLLLLMSLSVAAMEAPLSEDERQPARSVTSKRPVTPERPETPEIPEMPIKNTEVPEYIPDIEDFANWTQRDYNLMQYPGFAELADKPSQLVRRLEYIEGPSTAEAEERLKKKFEAWKRGKREDEEKARAAHLQKYMNYHELEYQQDMKKYNQDLKNMEAWKRQRPIYVAFMAQRHPGLAKIDPRDLGEIAAVAREMHL